MLGDVGIIYLFFKDGDSGVYSKVQIILLVE
jgi:hypothetical protein